MRVTDGVFYVLCEPSHDRSPAELRRDYDLRIVYPSTLKNKDSL